MAPTQLSPLDASFLRLEQPGVHMHIALVALFSPGEGRPPPTVEALRESIAGRLRHLPRLRQRLAFPPAGLGEPFWVDEPELDVAEHVVAYTEPHEEVTLASFDGLVDTVLSEPLDRSRPLWHFVLVPRLEDGRAAIIGRLHHAVADGLGGLDIGMALFSAEPHGPPEPDQTWAPQRVPGAAELSVAAVRSQLGLLGRGLAAAARAAARPRTAAVGAVRSLAQLAATAREDLLSPAPPSFLNRPIGPERRLVRHRADIAPLLAAKERLGVTLNDVCVAAVAGALRRLAHGRLELPDALRAAIPVSLRSQDDPRYGNRVSFAFIDLPVGLDSPERRLAGVHEQTQHFKHARRADVAGWAIEAMALLPPPLRGAAASLAAGSWMFNLTVSNVPGPHESMYALGAEVDEVYLLAPLAAQHALSVAFFTYRDGVHFGLFADPEAFPEVDELGGALAQEIAELTAVTRPPAPALA
jgi:WS/DGAT/MGAT family acyltransferase